MEGKAIILENIIYNHHAAIAVPYRIREVPDTYPGPNITLIYTDIMLVSSTRTIPHVMPRLTLSSTVSDNSLTTRSVCDFRLLLPSRRELRSSGLLRAAGGCNFLTTFRDILWVPTSGFKNKKKTEDGTKRLSRNVGKKLPLFAAL